MRIGDILYFSPKFKFADLNWDDKNGLITAFQDRIIAFCLKPAQKLSSSGCSFAAGVICVTTVDFLARIETELTDDVGKRFEEWLKINIEQFNKPDPDNKSRILAARFYKEFRNGLVHEGRIKNAGQFSYDFQELIKVEQLVMIVNPECLLNSIETSFKRYVDKIEKDEFAFQNLKCALLRDFREDVEYANR